MKNMKKGFTLIELLVVVLIIGILAAIALPQYQKAVAKAKAADALVMLRAINDAQESYFLANNSYTDDLEDLEISVPDNRIYKNMTAEEVSKKYHFICWDKRTCGANINNSSLPYFEFHMLRAGNVLYRGKKWCRGPISNALANDICVILGGIKDWQSDTFIYYKIN